MACTASGIARLNAIRAIADPADPVFATILAAEAKFIAPLLAAFTETGQLPQVLRFSRPANAIEEAVQALAATFVADLSGRTVGIEYLSAPLIDFELRRRQRVACLDVPVGWQLAAQTIRRRTADAAARAPSAQGYCSSVRNRAA